MPAIRAFIAIEIPLNIQQQLERISAQFKAGSGSAVRWDRVEKIHLTLKFLGDVQPAQLAGLKQALQTASRQHPPFEIEIGGSGAFPNASRPRVVWVGVKSTPALMALQRSVDLDTRPLGFPGENHPFSAHLTLGRVNDHALREDVARLSALLASARIGSLGMVTVGAIQLIKSDLRPTGAVYTLLETFGLKETDSEPA